MKLHPEVLAALQSAHDAEATASEMWHKQEHAFKQGEHRIPKLAKWFDRRHKEAANRQHAIRGHMMRFGGTVETNLGDTSYSDDPAGALKIACDTLDGLIEAYQGIQDAAFDHSDQATSEKFHGRVHGLRKLYKKGEQKQQQLTDLGPELFVHKHS